MELIDSLNNFKQMFSNKGDFIFTYSSFELNTLNKQFVDCWYDLSVEINLFSTSVERKWYPKIYWSHGKKSLLSFKFEFAMVHLFI